MRRLVMIIFVMFCSLASVTARSEPLSGNNIHEICKTNHGTTTRNLCDIYYMGVFEGTWSGAAFIAFQLGSKSANEVNTSVESFLRACIPPEATNQQIADIAVKFLIEHPAQRHNSARLLALLAWQEAFPCTD